MGKDIPIELVNVDNPMDIPPDIVDHPKEIMGHIVFTIPVLVAFRPEFNVGNLAKWVPPVDLPPIVARAFKESIPHQNPDHVKVIAGATCRPDQLPMSFAYLGLVCEKLAPASREESSAEFAADFIQKYFDADLVLEILEKRMRGDQGIKK